MSKFKIKFHVGEEHAYLTMFAGEDIEHLAKCGDLTLTVVEWQDFVQLMSKSEVVFEERNKNSAYYYWSR